MLSAERPGGLAQALALDGYDLGKASFNRRGTLEFEISEEHGALFPSGFESASEPPLSAR